MEADYFTHPEIFGPVLQKLLEIDHVLKNRVLLFFRLWVPLKEIELLESSVKQYSISELRERYCRIDELSMDRSIQGEFEERNRIRIKKESLPLICIQTEELIFVAGIYQVLRAVVP